MKKLLAVLALAMVATPAFAGISGTNHDMNFVSGDIASNTAEICVFCHTPHGADTTVADAPLWNRSTVNLSATNPYVGIAMTTAPVAADYVDTDAPLCISCHDGVVGETLQNEPNVGDAGILAGYVMKADALLSTDMSDDHPIGFVYSSVPSADGGPDTEIQAKAVVEAVPAMVAALSYGPTDNDMWCSSCHDVHNNVNGAFLRINNAGSNLCLTCHIK